jgi:selenide,water dikinase
VQVLHDVPRSHNPGAIVDFDMLDDAGIYELADGMLLVQTVDFFTPVVDDPYTFGRVAAVNSLSDIYAMGGVPKTALNIVCFPVKEIDLAVLGAILKGGAEVLARADVALLGGHTVEDSEPKYGLAVTGTVEKGKVVMSAGARPGDRLVLTKPLGSGVITTAMREDSAPKGAGELAIATMLELNRPGAEAMQAVGVHACTDITGFGLLGHAHEMAIASGVALRIVIGDVPLIPGARECAEQGSIPGGSEANQLYVTPFLEVGEGVSETDVILLADAQTSGGLLIAVAPEREQDLLDELKARGAAVAVRIGEVVEGSAGGMELVR